jgi:hypothetical protein
MTVRAAAAQAAPPPPPYTHTHDGVHLPKSTCHDEVLGEEEGPPEGRQRWRTSRWSRRGGGRCTSRLALRRRPTASSWSVNCDAVQVAALAPAARQRRQHCKGSGGSRPGGEDIMDKLGTVARWVVGLARNTIRCIKIKKLFLDLTLSLFHNFFK